MAGRRLSLARWIAALLVVASAPVGAEPMDLRDPTARAVSVRFENSPADAPAALRDSFTVDIPARFEMEPGTGRARVRIAGADVERGYFHRQRLLPGSFSEYVWTFDPRTGHVVSASLSGIFVRSFDFGLFAREVETPFEATLTTLRSSGFGRAHRIFGQLVFPLCETASSDCTLVPPAPYDSATGYVNAVGAIGARALGITAQSFAAIGEAIFSEEDGPPGYAGLR